MNLCFYMAIRTIPLGLAIAIEFTGPLSLAMIHARKPIHFFWIALAVAGLAPAAAAGRRQPEPRPGGRGLRRRGGGVLGACTSWPASGPGHLHGGRSVALGMATAAVVVAPFGLVSAGRPCWSPVALGLGLVVAVVSSAIPIRWRWWPCAASPSAASG